MSKNSYICDCRVIHEYAVDSVICNMPCDSLLTSVSNFLKVLSDKTRCKIVSALLTIKELCVCDIANVLQMTKSSISHQLRKMRDCGIVKFRRYKKQVLYSLNDGHVRSIFQTTLSHVKHITGEKDENE